MCCYDEKPGKGNLREGYLGSHFESVKAGESWRQECRELATLPSPPGSRETMFKQGEMAFSFPFSSGFTRTASPTFRVGLSIPINLI